VLILVLLALQLLLLLAVEVAALAPVLRKQVVETVVQAAVEKVLTQGQLGQELLGKDTTAAVVIRVRVRIMEQAAVGEAAL